jgi:predicted MFS family arabinose efflux permease
MISPGTRLPDEPNLGPARSRWSVVAAFAVVAGATQLVWLNYAPVTSVAAAHFGVSAAAIGWLANMFPLWYVILAVPGGMILDRWFKAGVAAGALLTAAGAVLRLGGDSYAWALAGQVVVAIGQPLVLNAIPGVARNYLAEKDRASGIALSSAGTFAGMVAAYVLGAVLPDVGDLGVLIGLSAGVAGASAAAVLVALRQPAGALAPRPSAPRTGLWAALGDRFVRRICLLAFLSFGAFDAVATFAQALLEPAGIPAGIASVMLVLMMFAGVLACGVVPAAAARRRREGPTMVTGLLVAVVSCLLLAITPSVLTAVVGLTAIGLVLLPNLPILLELVERRAGEAEGTASGLLWLAGNLGAIVVTGMFVHLPLVAFLICGGVALLAVPLPRGLGRTP